MGYTSGRYKKYKRARSKSRTYKSKYRKYKSKYQRKKYPTSPWGWNGNKPMKSIASGAEKKYLDSAFVQVTPYRASHVIEVLNACQQGADINQRIGNKIRIISVQVQASIIQKLTSVSDRVRLVLIYDNAPNGVGATINDMFNNVNEAAFAYMNLNYRDRFRVIAEETFTLGGVYTFGSPTLYNALAPGTANVDRYVKTDLLTTYNSSVATIGAIATGGLYLCILGGSATTAAEGFLVRFTTRVRFVDY
jgi:hypothetical protein